MYNGSSEVLRRRDELITYSKPIVGSSHNGLPSCNSGPARYLRSRHFKAGRKTVPRSYAVSRQSRIANYRIVVPYLGRMVVPLRTAVFESTYLRSTASLVHLFHSGIGREDVVRRRTGCESSCAMSEIVTRRSIALAAGLTLLPRGTRCSLRSPSRIDGWMSALSPSSLFGARSERSHVLPSAIDDEPFADLLNAHHPLPRTVVRSLVESRVP